MSTCLSNGLNTETMDLHVLVKEGTECPFGLFGFISIDPVTRDGELIKMIGDPKERGKGFARKATEHVIQRAFSVLGLNRIHLCTIDGNMKNIQLNDSLRFRFEGLLRRSAWVSGRLCDVVVMGLLREEVGGSR